MDPVRNPFAPGAGSQPPELAGRDDIIRDARTALQRVLLAKHGRSHILLGLRGVGKTVLLNRIEEHATEFGYLTSFIEAPESRKLVELLYPRLHQAIRQLSLLEQSKVLAYRAMAALAALAGTFKISVGDLSIAIDPEIGAADSGNLEYDLADMFVRIGEAARSAGKGWTLLIDEIQYLSEQDLSALIVAVHRVNQKNLPVVFFGAGLPQVAALSGDAKSYAERLFDFTTVGALDVVAASNAIRQPVESELESIDDSALELIVEKTHGYPYFLQEWGYQAWNAADTSPISREDVDAASTAALARLDQGFFKVRFDRLTPKERDYVIAMAKLGTGPYRSSDVAEMLGENIQKLGPRRSQIIGKGMIYSPAHGDIAFTVPMFEDYLARNWM